MKVVGASSDGWTNGSFCEQWFRFFFFSSDLAMKHLFRRKPSMLELKMPQKETLVVWFYGLMVKILTSETSWERLIRFVFDCHRDLTFDATWHPLIPVMQLHHLPGLGRHAKSAVLNWKKMRHLRGWGTGYLRWFEVIHQHGHMAKYLQQPRPHLIWETKWKMMLARPPATKSSRAMSSGLRACPTN